MFLSPFLMLFGLNTIPCIASWRNVSKEFELYWGVVFLRLEEKSFLIDFIGVIFEAGIETREKIWSDFGGEQKWRAERKEWFLFIPLFSRERKIDVWKNFL